MKKLTAILLVISMFAAGCGVAVGQTASREEKKPEVQESTTKETEEETIFIEKETEPEEDGKVYLHEMKLENYAVPSFVEKFLGANYKDKSPGEGDYYYWDETETMSLSSSWGKDLSFFRKDVSICYTFMFEAFVNGLCGQPAALESQFEATDLPNGDKVKAQRFCDDLAQTIGFPYEETECYVIDTEYANHFASVFNQGGPTEEAKEADSQPIWYEDEGAYLFVYRDSEFAGQSRSAWIWNNVLYMVYSPKYGLCALSASPKLVEINKQEVDIISEEQALSLWEDLARKNEIHHHVLDVTGAELTYAEQFMEDRSYGEGTTMLRPCWKLKFTWKPSQNTRFWEEMYGVSFIPGEAKSEGYLLLDAITGDVNYFIYD